MNFLVANNETNAAMDEKGYKTRYAHGLDACHCYQPMILEDFPNTLLWAWAEWKELLSKKVTKHTGSPKY